MKRFKRALAIPLSSIAESRMEIETTLDPRIAHSLSQEHIPPIPKESVVSYEAPKRYQMDPNVHTLSFCYLLTF
jgi:hypothetical protein